MNINFADPVLWICVGVILICLIFLVWAIGKLKGAAPAPTNDLLFDTPTDPSPASRDFSAFNITQTAPPPPRPDRSVSTPGVAAAGAGVNREMADRLEVMSQRLADMQSVLTKQAGAPTVAGAAGGSLGQGFSPETIDKLLKIIGGVVQQVDLLQKSLNFDGASPATGATASSPPAPATAPSTMPRPMGNLSAVQPPKPNPKP